MRLFKFGFSLGKNNENDSVRHENGRSEAQNATVDPVCGMKISISDGTPKSTIDGVDYWFCSADCKQKFDSTH